MVLRRFHPLALLLLSLLLSACGYQLTTELGPAGAGEFVGEITFTADDQAALAEANTTPQAFCEDFQARGLLPGGHALAYEEREEDFRCMVTVPFGSLDELRALYAELDGVTVNTLDLSGDRLTYDLTVQVASSAESAQVGGASQLRWVLRPPGTVVEHNAADDENDTLVWNVAFDQPMSVRAVTTISVMDRLQGAAGWLIGLVCLVGVIIVAVVVMSLLRRRPARP